MAVECILQKLEARLGGGARPLLKPIHALRLELNTIDAMAPTPSLLMAIALGWTLPASAAVCVYRVRRVSAGDGRNEESL